PPRRPPPSRLVTYTTLFRSRDRRDDGGQLFGTHDRRQRGWPAKHEPRVERPTGHTVVTRTIGRAGNQRDMRDLGVRDSVNHLRAVLDDAALFILLPHHVAGGVVHEDQRGVARVGQLNELRGFLGFLTEQ